MIIGFSLLSLVSWLLVYKTHTVDSIRPSIIIEHRANVLKFSQDGNLLVGLNVEGPRSSLYVWNAQTGHKVWHWNFPNSEIPLGKLSLSGDSQHVAAVSVAESKNPQEIALCVIRVWDVGSGEILRFLARPAIGGRATRYLHKKVFATYSRREHGSDPLQASAVAFYLWDSESLLVEYEHSRSADAFWFRDWELLDLRTGVVKPSWTVPSRSWRSVQANTATRSILITNGVSSQIYDFGQQRLLWSCDGGARMATEDLAFISTYDQARNQSIWKVDSNTIEWRSSVKGPTPWDIAPDGSMFAAPHGEGLLSVRRLNNGTVVRDIEMSEDGPQQRRYITSICFAPDSRRIASCSVYYSKPRIQIWRLSQ